MKTNKLFSDWAIYMIASPAILAISLMAALCVSCDFQNDSFVKSVTFVGSNILLWTIYLTMVNCPYEVMCVIQKNAVKKVSSDMPVSETLSEVTIPQPEPVRYSHDDYVKRVEAQEKERHDEKERRLKAVLEYTHRTMSRFLHEEELNTLLDEIRKWSEDFNYTPCVINRFKKNVGNLPLRHFVWNIAERLGRREYNMAIRIDFIRSLFPKPFEGLDYSTLKNLKAPCSKELIPIDEPVNGELFFHDKSEEFPE